MDLHCQMILDEYKENQETFEIIKSIVLKELKGFTDKVGTIINSVESRIKTENSLIGKLELKGHKYKTLKDITDIVGARIVTFYSDEIDKYAAKVEQTFKIDWDDSVDKRKMYKVDQFGYMSLHYICQIPESLYKDEAHPLVNVYRFEIQIRSVLQHAWASIYHDTGYKNDIEVPKEYLRSLNRLAGLLELADQEFVEIKNGLEAYRREVKQIVKSGSYEGVELNGDSFTQYMSNGAFDKLNEKIATINNMEIQKVSPQIYLEVFKYFQIETLADLDKLLKEHFDLAYQLAIRIYDGTDIDIISSNTGLMMFSLAHILSSGFSYGEVLYFLDYINGKRKSNATFAQKIIDIAKQMGILK